MPCPKCGRTVQEITPRTRTFFCGTKTSWCGGKWIIKQSKECKGKEADSEDNAR